MKKLLFNIILCLSIAASAQNRIVTTSDKEPVKFHGIIGHKDQRPTGLMANSFSLDQLKENCHFFGGDTLEGFDFEKSSNQTFAEGGKLLMEYKNRMRSLQIDFVKNKFHLIRIPKFERVNTYKAPAPPSVLTSGCNNIDFEDGNLYGWNIQSGVNQNSNAPLTIYSSGTSSTNEDIYGCSDVNIINSLYGTDVIGLPGLDPQGGSTSVRLGGAKKNTSEGVSGCFGYHWDNIYSDGEQISKTIAVTSANALMAYDYEIILNDGGHLNGQQPYFHVYISDPSGAVLSTCTEYYVQAVAGAAPAGFINSGWVSDYDNSAIYIKPWTSNSINLTPYIGQNVVVSFATAGCTLGGHFAYAYVDAICGPVQVIASTTAPCNGTNLTLTAPSVQNGTYSWSGPGISGSNTNQTVIVTSSGTYSVIVTPSLGCSYTISKQITFLQSPIATIAAVPAAICAGSTLSISTTITGGSGVYSSTNWTGTGAGSLSATTISNPNFTNSVNGSYPLFFTVTDANGCFATANTTVIVNGFADPTVTQSELTLTANATGAAYQWINCNGNTPIAGANSQSYSPSASGSYAVIVTQNSCVVTSICYNLNSSSSCQVTITGADLPYSGLTVFLANDTLTAVPLGTPCGTSQSWDYSMLLNHYPKFADYNSTATTPYASAFPASNIYTYGPSVFFGTLYGGNPMNASTTNGYAFWESDNTGLWAIGFRPDGGAYAGTNVQNNPKELLIGAPASFGSVFNNFSRWELPMNKNSADVDTFYVRNINKVITADACGSITTPYNSYPTILREHEYVITVDSIYARYSGFLVSAMEYKRDTLNNYTYLSNGIGYPVCIVHADKNNTIKDVEYFNGILATGINDKQTAETQLSVYPSPSNGIFTIEIPKIERSNDNQIFIYNSIGSLVWKKNTQDAITVVDISNLPKGIYFVNIYNNEKKYTEKIIVQ